MHEQTERETTLETETKRDGEETEKKCRADEPQPKKEKTSEARNERMDEREAELSENKRNEK